MTKEEKHQKIKLLQDDIEKLASVARQDNNYLVRLKKCIKQAPIQRYQPADIDLGFFASSLFRSSTAEFYGAYLYVKDHKKEVDKLLTKKHQELKELEKKPTMEIRKLR